MKKFNFTAVSSANARAWEKFPNWVQFEIFFCSDLISAELKIKVYFLACLPDTLTHLFLPYIWEYPLWNQTILKIVFEFSNQTQMEFWESVYNSSTLFFLALKVNKIINFLLCRFIYLTLIILGQDYHLVVCTLMVILKYICKNFK